MNEDFLRKRITETKTEIFPLDRLLPLESVYLIFSKEYNSVTDKNLFFRDRKYQRLREAYFSMFVAVSLQDTSIGKEQHYLVFPSNPDNDVYITKKVSDEKIPKHIAYEFDIKEYTDWSPSFDEFMEKSIIPKIEIYNIAIPTYRKIDGSDIESLINFLKSKNLINKIWFLGLPDKENYNYDISALTIIDKDGIVYKKTLNLKDWIQTDTTPMIFQDVIRFKDL